MIDNGQLDKTLKLDFPKAAGDDRQDTLHRSRSHCALDPCVYDFKKSSPKSNAPQTRMDARGVFTTLITQNINQGGFLDHSTVTLLARLRGLSTSVPRAHAVWYASSCNGTTCSNGLRAP